jgi:hypothetical protein
MPLSVNYLITQTIIANMHSLVRERNGAADISSSLLDATPLERERERERETRMSER